MSNGSRPFTEQVTRSGRIGGGSGNAKAGWIAAGVLVVALIAALLGWAITVGKMRGLQRVQADLQEANASLANAVAKSQKDQDQIAALQNQIADLQKDKEMAAQAAKSLEDEMRSDLESKDVTISKLQGKLTVNILDRVLFDSGEAVLKPGGEAVMRKIAALLAAHPTLKIHVVGHTDNIPMRSRFASNWELSTARALAAVHFLTEKAGVDPRRVGAVGYGEFRPIADNSTAEGRAKNRRIAITILPDELAGSDASPAAQLPPPAPPSAATGPIPSPPLVPPAAALAPAPPVPVGTDVPPPIPPPDQGAGPN